MERLSAMVWSKSLNEMDLQRTSLVTNDGHTSLDNMPSEIKGIILSHCDRVSTCAIRLTSKSWAAAGLEFLLVPTMQIGILKSHTERLKNLTSGSKISRLAATKVEHLVLIDREVDLETFRDLLVDEIRQDTGKCCVEVVAALREICELSEQIASHDDPDTTSVFERMFLHFTRLKSVTFLNLEIFKHRHLQQLRKQFASEAAYVQKPTAAYQMAQILIGAGFATGTGIKSLRHAQLHSGFFGDGDSFAKFSVPLSRLETLDLTINDINQSFSGQNKRYHSLGQMLQHCTQLKNLSLTIECLERWHPAEIPLESILVSTLYSLQLDNICLLREDFLSLLGKHTATLHTLVLGHQWGVDLTTDQDGGWHAFLLDLRSTLSLSHFQLAGGVRVIGEGRDRDSWFIPPVRSKDGDWRSFSVTEKAKGFALQQFVIENGPWPMSTKDDWPALSL